MYKNLGVRDKSRLQLSDNASQSFTAILKLLTALQVDTTFASDFSESFEIREVQLGDELVNYTLPVGSGDSVHHEQDEANKSSFYLVCQGRVRLLCFDPAQQREVSAMVLEAGETFGADDLFCNISSPYRVIAASASQIACIPIAKLQPWLEQLPALREHLLLTSQRRQCLIFFKTFTELRSLTSHTLRQLLPYVEETLIPAGEKLAESSQLGRFWLRSGQIRKQEHVSASPVGESWGYANPTPPDGIAETDLLVYKLDRADWQEVQELAPMLADGSSQQAEGNGHQPQAVRTAPTPTHNSSNRRIERQKDVKQCVSTAGVRPAQPEIIDLPQPTKQRRRRWLGQGYPFIQQQSTADCGATCLAMLGQYWLGKPISLNYLRNLAGVGRAGASLKNLATAAESLGFHARPVRASLSSLVEQKNPWIAHWQGDHYVVVYRVKGNKILIADPGMGKRLLPRQEFLANWTGYALLLDSTDKLAAPETEKNSLGRFMRALWPYRSLIGQIILASLLIQVFGLITPLFTQIILDRVVVNKSLITLHVFSIGLLLFGVWQIGLTAIRQYLLDYFSNRLDLSLISGFISHALRLPLKFFESRHVGDIVTRVQENQKIQMFLTRQAVVAWLDALMAFVYLGLMIYYNWQLTLLVVALIPPIVILTLVATPFLRRVSREIFNQSAAENSALVEMFTGIGTVKVAAAEQDLRWRWEDRLTNMLNARFHGQKLANGLQATSGIINTLGSTALLWYGATLVIQDQLTIGQFVAFNMLIGHVINPILGLTKLWDELQEVVISVERLDDVFSAQTEENPQKPLLVLPRLRGDVKLENITFRYGEDDERNTLQNIAVEVKAGQTIAIVGRSGSGKTTLVSLLQGLHHPNSGRILMDGHDIRHVSPQSLRTQLGVVPQECFLFSGTILENITLFRPEFTLEQVVEVAKLAEAHAFIQDLPLGYNTKVGERGSNLSGGQRQRIAIARALLGDPRILILDEATSSLDTDSERRFQQNLARISRDRTTFIIAHRLSTVRHADCILVLDRGILTERGTHDELIALHGLYYHLAQQQLDL